MTDVPSPAIPHYERGIGAFRKEDWNTAIIHFCKAGRADKTYFRAYVWLGLALDRAGRPDQAIKAFRASLAIAPLYHKAYNNLGESLRQLLDHHQAMVAFKTATEISPEISHYHYNLGLTLIDMGRNEEAEDALTRALSLDPVNLGTVSALARLYIALDRPRCADRTFDTFLQAAPDHKHAAEIKLRKKKLASLIEKPPRPAGNKN